MHTLVTDFLDRGSNVLGLLADVPPGSLLPLALSSRDFVWNGPTGDPTYPKLKSLGVEQGDHICAICSAPAGEVLVDCG